jgi:Tfp pilus assembly protein PilX
MEKQIMKELIQNLKDGEEGYVIITTLLILAMVTAITFMAMNTSNTEVQISTNALLYQKTFYAAEAGLEHALKLLEGSFVAHNAFKVKTGATADWNFALNGSSVNPANDPNGDGKGGYDSDVSVWNNDDDGDFQTDTDGYIWLQSDANSPRGSRVSVRVLVEGNTTGEGITGYTAQAGAGAGKNYNANDLNPIRDFSRQL